jgi:lysozyme
MDIGDNGRRLIHHFEGRTPFAYNDPVGFCTAGPGILLHRSRCTPDDYRRYGTRHDPGIGDREYERMFRRAIEPREAELERIIGRRRMRSTKRHEFSALLALGWNIGMGALASSSAMRFHKARLGFAAGRAILLFNKGGGVVLEGLVRRRKSERHLYRKGELKLNF